MVDLKGGNGVLPPELVKKLKAIAMSKGQLHRFDTGEVLRTQGMHYNDMFLVLEGRQRVTLGGTPGPRRTVEIGPGSVIGEIGFLSGAAASGTVTALEPGLAVNLDDDLIGQIEATDRKVAVDLMQQLAAISTARLEADKVSQAAADFGSNAANSDAVEILMCRTPEHLRAAQKLRYAVYCGELGRSSPYADHEAETISDGLDEFADVFIARSGERVVGTMRVNQQSRGDLGILADLYGISASPCRPEEILVVTKFALAREVRGGTLSLDMIATAVRYSVRIGIKETFIDCVPRLEHYYRALWFRPCAPSFLHPENGLSQPMKLNLERYGRRMAKDPRKLQLAGFFIRSKLHKWRGKISSSFRSTSREGE